MSNQFFITCPNCGEHKLEVKHTYRGQSIEICRKCSYPENEGKFLRVEEVVNA